MTREMPANFPERVNYYVKAWLISIFVITILFVCFYPMLIADGWEPRYIWFTMFPFYELVFMFVLALAFGMALYFEFFKRG